MRRISIRALLVAFGILGVIGAAITTIAVIPALGSLGEGISTFSATSSGAIVTSTNGGSGTGVESITGATAGGQAVYGLGNNALHASTAVHGKVLGPSSVAFLAEAVNTDAAHPSSALKATSISGYGVYALTSAALSPAVYASNANTATTGTAIQAFSTGNAILGQSAKSNGVLGITKDCASISICTGGVMGITQERCCDNDVGVVGQTTNGRAGVEGDSFEQCATCVGSSGPTVETGVEGMAVGSGAGTAPMAGVVGQAVIVGTDTGMLDPEAGVIGVGSGAASIPMAGVVGIGASNNNVGFHGFSVNSIAGIFEGDTSHAAQGPSSYLGAVVALDESNGGGSSGAFGQSNNGAGIVGEAGNGNGGRFVSSALPPSLPADNFFRAAIAGQGLGGAPLLILRNSSGIDVASVSNAGDLRILGNLFAHSSTVGTPGNPLIVHRTTLGNLGSYSPQQTVATIEDVGEAQLVNGIASVRIDPGFAALIDPRSAYLVFVTPQGDTPGLYVTQKSPAGFLVREHGFGHSTVAFDYRIVAKPIDADGRRLPRVASSRAGGRSPLSIGQAAAPRWARPGAFSLTRMPPSSSRRLSLPPRYNPGYLPNPLAAPPVEKVTGH